jgi:hypothetical protein
MAGKQLARSDTDIDDVRKMVQLLRFQEQRGI